MATVLDIQRATARHYGASVDDLRSQDRGRSLAWPRQTAMYLARVMTEQSLPDIGAKFGGRDHTTVMHAIRRVPIRAAEHRITARALVEIRRNVEATPSFVQRVRMEHDLCRSIALGLKVVGAIR